jgi:hypothetical protein
MKIVTNANTGTIIVITAIGQLSNTLRSTYSVASGIRNLTGEKKHSKVPNITTNKRYKV